MDLTDAHVLVTGASRGIGRGLAEEFHRRGARLSVVARSAGPLDELAARLGARAHVADLVDAGARRGLMAAVESAGGPVDVLVNNAGVDMTGALWDTGADDLERLYLLNALVPAELARQALPGMMARGRGHILNMSSLAGCGALPGMAAYASTKAALTHLTAGLRADLRGLPIGTTVVEVGLVKPTDMADAVLSYASAARAFARLYRLGMLADTPRDVVVRAAVDAVAAGRRHVRLPRRARGIALLPEAPRRSTELILTGVPPRG